MAIRKYRSTPKRTQIPASAAVTEKKKQQLKLLSTNFGVDVMI